MPLPERSAPPVSYPPRFTYPQVRAIVVAALRDKPALPADALTTGEQVSGADLNIRRIVTHYVRDEQHRRQLGVWAHCQEIRSGRGRSRLSFQEDSFTDICARRGWNRDTALKNVERALGMVFMMINLRDEGRF